MTRKDYQIIAAALLASKPTMPARPNSGDMTAKYQWVRVVHVMTDALERDNPNFDRVRFYAACGETE